MRAQDEVPRAVCSGWLCHPPMVHGFSPRPFAGDGATAMTRDALSIDAVRTQPCVTHLARGIPRRNDTLARPSRCYGTPHKRQDTTSLGALSPLFLGSRHCRSRWTRAPTRIGGLFPLGAAKMPHLPLWEGAGPPGPHRAPRRSVRKRGSNGALPQSRSEHQLSDYIRLNRGQLWRDLAKYTQTDPPTISDLIGRTDRRKITPDSRQADVCTRPAGREA